MTIKDFTQRLIHDSIYRTKVKLVGNLAINLFYAFTKMTLGIRAGSLWDMVLAMHYVILSLMRFAYIYYSMHHDFGANLKKEYTYYSVSGGLFIILDFILTISIAKMITTDQYTVYSDYRIYAMALYAFLKVYFAIRGILTSRKQKSPLYSSIKAVSFVSAFIALLSLETAMIDTFGDNAVYFRSVMVGATGLGVSVIVLATGGYMLIRGIREKHKFTQS